MTHIRFDYSKALAFFGEHELTYLRDAVKVAHHSLHEKTGVGNDFLGWLDWPVNYDKEEFARIKQAAKKFNQTLMSFLSSVSAARILGRVRRLRCCIIRFTMPCRKRSGPHRKSSLSATTLARRI